MKKTIPFLDNQRPRALCRKLWIAPGILLASCALLAVIRTHIPTFWERASLAEIRPESGFAYIAPTGHPEQSSHQAPSSARVLENGTPLPGPGNALHEDIRKVGQGRYSFWHDCVYFSSSDNTDPRTNRRRYEIQYPNAAVPVFVTGLWWLVGLGCFFCVLFLTVLLLRYIRISRIISPRPDFQFWRGIVQRAVNRTRYFLASRRPEIICKILWIATASLFASSVLLLLITTRMPAHWEQAVLAKIRPELGFAYIAPTGHPEQSSHEEPSAARVLENGTPLPGPANALHEDIRKIGTGRYSFWHGQVYFSASDNTNPRTNGRRYEIQYPINTMRAFAKGFYWLAGLVSFLCILFSGVLLLRHDSLARVSRVISSRPAFLLCCVLVTLFFLIPRLPWFIDYPLPIVSYDTGSYFNPLRQMFSSQWPDFTNRTPGYPLFMAAVFLISPRLMPVIVLQNLLTLASVLFFLWAVYRAQSQLLIGATVVMIAHVTQPLLSGHDFILMTESLFTSLLLFCLGFLCLAIHKKRPRHFFMFSALGGYAILVRPAGLFLLSCLLITLVYLLINRCSMKSIMCLALPMPVMIIMLMTYNYVLAGHFVISTLSDLTLYGITSTYWEPDGAFPKAVNTGIERFRAEIADIDQQVLCHSWDPVKLVPLFVNTAGNSIFRSPYRVFNVAPELNTQEQLALAKRVARKAISRHPEMFVKFFWANLYSFLADESSWRTFLYNDMVWAAKQMYIEGSAADKFIGREYAQLPAIPNLRLEGGGEKRHFVVVPTLLCKAYFEVAGFVGKVFDCKAWLLAYFVVLFLSLLMTVRSKCRHRGAFLLLVLSSLHLAAGIVITLSTSMVNRYPSPTRFAEVLAVAFLPLLFLPGDEEPAYVADNSLGSEKAGKGIHV